MTKYFKKIGYILVSLPLLAVEIKNPAKGLFIDYGEGKNTFPELLVRFINIALGIVGLVSIAFIIYGGFLYITSRGDEEQATAGKKTLFNAIIGLIIVILSYIIVVVVINALKGKVR